MKFKLDENLPDELAAIFREAGHDASTVLDQEMGGKPDLDVAAVCQQETRTLVTLDTDFADIRAYPPEDCAGLLVFRLQRQDKFHVLDVARRLVSALEQETLHGRLWIVEENRIRVRTPR